GWAPKLHSMVPSLIERLTDRLERFWTVRCTIEKVAGFHPCPPQLACIRTKPTLVSMTMHNNVRGGTEAYLHRPRSLPCMGRLRLPAASGAGLRATVSWAAAGPPCRR